MQWAREYLRDDTVHGRNVLQYLGVLEQRLTELVEVSPKCLQFQGLGVRV